MSIVIMDSFFKTEDSYTGNDRTSLITSVGVFMSPFMVVSTTVL